MVKVKVTLVCKCGNRFTNIKPSLKMEKAGMDIQHYGTINLYCENCKEDLKCIFNIWEYYHGGSFIEKFYDKNKIKSVHLSCKFSY